MRASSAPRRTPTALCSILISIAFLILFTGCSNKATTEEPDVEPVEQGAETSSERIQEHVARTGEVVEESFDESKEALKRGVEKTGKTVKDGIDKGVTKTGEAIEKFGDKLKELGK